MIFIQDYAFVITALKHTDLVHKVSLLSSLHLTFLSSLQRAILVKLFSLRVLSKTSRNAFIIGYAHIQSFKDCYFNHLAITYIDLAIAVNKTLKVPQSLFRGRLNIDEFEDGEIIHQPFGVVFQGKKIKGKLTKFLFQTNDIDRYTSNILLCINNCNKNNNEDKGEVRKINIWYVKIRKELLQILKRLA